MAYSRFNPNQQQQQNQQQKRNRKYASGVKTNHGLVLAVVEKQGLEHVPNSLPRPFAELAIETPQGNRYNVRAYGKLAQPLREIEPGQTFEYMGRWAFGDEETGIGHMELVRFNAPKSKDIDPYFLQLQELAKAEAEEAELERQTRPDPNNKGWDFGQ